MLSKDDLNFLRGDFDKIKDQDYKKKILKNYQKYAEEFIKDKKVNNIKIQKYEKIKLKGLNEKDKQKLEKKLKDLKNGQDLICIKIENYLNFLEENLENKQKEICFQYLKDVFKSHIPHSDILFQLIDSFKKINELSKLNKTMKKLEKEIHSSN